ncbi:HECT-domain ubiquitin-transferase [Nitzschia inconspicua]|uniref:HECT-domain ubiquitin-transferase n=1 Tax=Nitzschia inconspicua TaxID=303405 RepID=A0A9K3L107_9STRA|nr:HECT-domain ubiquitin-transferase [Nitzschia inconspicua]
MNNMWGEPPSGREQAIETLIDMDPNGSFYRASRILEEAVPQDLLQRPNLVTKSALVDQAYALSKFEVDTVEKYDVLFGIGADSTGSSLLHSLSFATRLRRAEFDNKKNRILKHHSKILEAKKARYQQSCSPFAPSPQLVAALRQVYGSSDGESSSLRDPKTSEESSILRSLLKSIMGHPAFSYKDDENKGLFSATAVPKSTETFHEPLDTVEENLRDGGSATFALESLIAYLCEHLDNDGSLPSAALEHGLMIAVLSALMGCQAPDGERKMEKSYQSVPTQRKSDGNIEAVTMSPLQVGSLLSLIHLDDDSTSENPWALDKGLINYLGEAAAAYEERIEIQTARLLKRVNVDGATAECKTSHESDNDGATRKNEGVGAESAGNPTDRMSREGSLSNHKTLPPTIPSPETRESPANSGTPDAVNEEEIETVGASATVSGQLDEEPSEGREEPNLVEDSEDLVVLNSGDEDFHVGHLPGDSDGEESIVEDEDNESSSSSSSSASGADPEDGDEHDELGEEEDEEEDDYIDEEVEEQDDEVALRQALALSLVEQLEAPGSDSRIVVAELERAASDLVTPGKETLLNDEKPQHIQEEFEESPLPPLPPTPEHNPHANELSIKIDDEQEGFDAALSLDPSALQYFGSLPTRNVLMHLLKLLGDVMNRRVREKSECDVDSGSKEAPRIASIPGGMGSHLFPPVHPFVKTMSSTESDRDTAVSMQLLVALLLLTSKRRNEAIESLKQLLELESEVTQDNGEKNVVGFSTGEEGDDPAIAMALTYFEDEVMESKDSLEAKGMTRKAAAAAHDAAVLLESLRRRSNAWRDEVKLYSHCVVVAMRYLRHFFQNITRRWLQERQGFSATDCNVLLPEAVKSNLVDSLSSFLSSTEILIPPAVVENDKNLHTQIETVFMSTKLHQESLILWGEILPLAYPTVSDQSKFLRLLLGDCSSAKSSSVDSQIENDVHMSRIQILCRRLRVSDLLDRFVPSPVCMLPGENQSGNFDKSVQMPTAGCDSSVSSVISLMGTMSTALGGMKGEVRNFYLSLCHRCHARILLWDGLFACTEGEADDPTLAVTIAPADSLRLNFTVSNRLQFDATKCSDSMAILTNVESSNSVSNASSVHQRASKVWGTVLSSVCFAPKTGIHRWAIRLDKCERGHVFVGVATSQASTRTYVGGDKFGWGMIGTQALWHDRRKIRGDYGDTFRTGSLIIVTLDTDAGTLSYSSWKDSSSTSSFSIDQVVHNIASPRRQGHAGGSLEDWGVAFEGLPLDSKLYPAVGLYQRDDRVTILAIDPSKEVNSLLIDLNAGLSFYPPFPSKSDQDKVSMEHVEFIQKFNATLQMDGMLYAEETLRRISENIQQQNSDNFLSETLLPSLAASLCLFPPSIPILSERFALFMLPKLRSLLTTMNDSFLDSPPVPESVFPFPREGKWVIRATGSVGSIVDAEEYIVDLSHTAVHQKLIGFQASGVGTTGKSKNGLVAIFGCIQGSLIHFVEEWTDSSDEGFTSLSSDDVASSCVVTARLSLDGRKFEGTYRNVQFGTSGQIAGMACEGDDPMRVQLFRFKESSSRNETTSFSATRRAGNGALIGLAHGHLADILGENPPSFTVGEFQKVGSATEKDTESSKDVRKCLLLDTLSGASIHSTKEDMSWLSANLATRFMNGLSWGGVDLSFQPNVLDDTVSSIDSIWDAHKKASQTEELVRQVDDVDDNLVSRSGGDAQEATEVWAWALKLIEDGVRKAIATNDEQIPVREKALKCCRLFCQISEFLLSLEVSSPPQVEVVGRDLAQIYEKLSSLSHIQLLKEEMVVSSEKAVLRLVSLRERVALLEQTFQSATVESIVVGLRRLLGRSYAEFCPTHPGRELGCHYLTGLSGAAVTVRKSLQGGVQQLVRALVNIAIRELGRRNGRNQDGSCMMVDSAMLALVASLTMVFPDDNICNEDLVELVINLVSAILNQHRNAILVKEETNRLTGEELVVEHLNKFGTCEVSRGILRATTALVHVLSFQVWSTSDLNKVAGPSASSLCLNVVMRELGLMNNLLVDLVREREANLKEKQSLRQWQGFCNQVVGAERSKTLDSNEPTRQVGSSGIIFLWGNGGQMALQSSSPQKPSNNRSAKQGSIDSTFAEKSSLFYEGFVHHYFSHWIHVLVAATKAKTSTKLLAEDPHWISLLLATLGMDANLQVDRRSRLPGRYRSRFLRLLFPVLKLSDPSSQLVAGLFDLAGSSCAIYTASLDEEEGIVSREIVSLLRRLHAPSPIGWRDCINNVIQSCLQTSGAALPQKVGIFCFLNGAFDTLGKGSHVLLKPAAAVPLSTEHQALLSSSKNHSSAGSLGASGAYPLPHHIVGNGTEGMVAGLCRSQAPAGIVSNIDLKNGVCEVILLNREQHCRDAFTDANSEESGANSTYESRKAFTVRALRSQLADVVQAQEFPIFVDGTVVGKDLLSTLLRECLAVISTARDDFLCGDDKPDRVFCTMEHKVDDITAALMILRASITLLSGEELSSQFLDEKDKDSMVLATLLDLAAPADTPSSETKDLLPSLSSPFMSSFPAHETRLVHVLSLFRRLGFEESVLTSTPEHVAKSRIADFITTFSKTNLAPSMATDKDHDKSQKTLLLSGSTLNVSSANSEVGTSFSTAGEASSSNRVTSQSTAASTDNSDEDNDNEESEAAATAAAHLREAAIAQMAELGLPRSWSELALRRVGGTNIEAAVHFCLERGGEMERLLAEEREREREGSDEDPSRRRANRSETGHLLRQLMEMGFPSRWCAEALAATGNNVDEALTWILTNGERLSAEDEGMEDAGDDEDDEDDDGDDDSDATDEPTTHPKDANHRSINMEAKDKGETEDMAAHPSWKGSVVPLRFISGRSIIDATTLSVSGLPNGGFSSVGTKGVLLTTGKWYYEAILETAGCLQIGWADGSFAGHCHAERGDGCGDGPSSWSFDGWRRYRWHSVATEWGCRWAEGDVVGCLVDMDNKIVSFTLNGKGEEIGMGVAFSGHGFRPCSGVYACVSFNRKEKLKLILGGSGSVPFKHQPPPGYKGVGEAVLNAVSERELLVSKELLLEKERVEGPHSEKPFLCDFSDGEHGHELMAWAHRYYGSDASVHLGSGRVKQNGSSSKTFSNVESSTAQCLMRRIEKVWSNYHVEGSALKHASTCGTDSETSVLDESNIMCGMHKGLIESGINIYRQFLSESLIIASLTARKLLLHLIIATGPNFDPSCIWGSMDATQNRVLRFWNMIEMSASLRSAGWVGEAGAMALAAEALGLGISSNDSTITRLSSETSDRSGLITISDLDDGVVLPSGGIVQLLSSVFDIGLCDSNLASTGRSLVACSEAAIGSDGGGAVLSFLLRGLQSAICKSEMFRRVAVAAVRRSVRQLSVVEYDGNDTCVVESLGVDDDIEKAITAREKSTKDEIQMSHQPDARLVSFLTGLLLSAPVASTLQNFQETQEDLFEAWSVGLLSASLPWRMICAFVAAGILNQCPSALGQVVKAFPTIAHYYARLRSTVARRVWAERAAMPVCSRYSQAIVELLCAVSRAVKVLELPTTFSSPWENPTVDAATPLPFPSSTGLDWEVMDGWISSDREWEIWIGRVDRQAVNWKTPSRSAVRALMEGGDGPPMLREGCTVMRGLDWDDLKYGNADGKDMYDEEKARQQEIKKTEESLKKTSDPADPVADDANPADGDEGEGEVADHNGAEPEERSKEKKRMSSPKLPIGVVMSIESWNGIPGMGRKVKWKLTGKEGVYRYGGDGGNFDLSHVEVNNKGTRVRKRHPLPESAEQCAARHGFGRAKSDYIILRLNRRQHKDLSIDGKEINSRRGILEWPEFGAGILIECLDQNDGSIVVTEQDLLYGSKDAGWEARFGQPSYVPGTEIHLRAEYSDDTDQAKIDSKYPSKSLYEELVGTTLFPVKNLRRKEDGEGICVLSEFRIQRSPKADALIQAPMPAAICFDRDFHASTLSLSRDGRTLSCISSDGRGTAFANIGFSKGVHYWEVKLEQADIGSVFIGVAEKPIGNSSSHSHDSPPRLNRWHGWGFVNFRATYTSGAERIYGAHCHAGDTIGVLLDCDTGRISFFFDGLKYGEHIINDLGCAFENLSPFGFNCDGCGSGGVGEGAPSGIEGSRSGRYLAQGSVRPRTLWPVVGLRNQGDRVTISSKWNSGYGVDGISTIRNLEAVAELCHSYYAQINDSVSQRGTFPQWFMWEAFAEYRRWSSDSWKRSVTRGSGPYRLATFGLDMDLDTSPIACATASALLGLRHALLPGDRVRLKRSAGRILELAEEAVVLGTYHGRLYYQIVTQKSEGGSLTEGGGRAWCWDESEVVDGLEVLNVPPKGMNIELPLMNRFKCPSKGGLKIVYENGAVVRSDLEIFDESLNLGSIPVDTVIPQCDVLERRVNSCGVVRFRVKYEALEGWISSRIRGGKEESIVIPVAAPDYHSAEENAFVTPGDCATEWFKSYAKVCSTEENDTVVGLIDTVSKFEDHVGLGTIEGLSLVDSDTFLAQTICKVCAFSFGGDPLDVPFEEVASALAFGIAAYKGEKFVGPTTSSLQANQAAASAFESLTGRRIPALETLLARASLLRAFNRRARVALPWLAIRPCQESSAILGGLYGHGASVDRAGRHSNSTLLTQWVQVPSLASLIRAIRGLFFATVKKELLLSVTEATTTPTPLSHDEYELPREIRTVRINRLRARRVMSADDVARKRKYSVFAQLQNETKAWGGAALRRGFVAKGHGGQKRAFKVKLIGEGVNDYSGPYREIFTDAVAEVLKFDGNGGGSLGVLDPTPNNVAAVGENRDLFMFSLNGNDITKIRTAKKPISSTEEDIQSSFSSLIAARDESSREAEESLVFLGRLAGTAFRHGIPLDLPLPLGSIWRAIVEEGSSGDCLEELDLIAYRQGSRDRDNDLLWWQRRMLNSFVSGVSSILPVELLPILSGKELRDLFCGNTEIDVDMLRQVVEYEGYHETDVVIEYFWDTLREFTHEERKLFLQFVWARNRLPLKATDFDAPFKILKDSTKDSDQSLPSASTCFFSLSLPEYKSKDQLREKLLFAINNVTTMETDFQTNSAEISEGYRAF